MLIEYNFDGAKDNNKFMLWGLKHQVENYITWFIAGLDYLAA